MKKILLSSVALLGLTAGALAADLPSRRAPAPYVAVPVFTWTGFYVGVNAGYGFSDSNNNNAGFFVPAGSFPGFPTAAGTVSTAGFASDRNNDGFVGGGQIGYNYQVGQIVFGVEADIQYADFGRDRNTFGTAVYTPLAGTPFPTGFVPASVGASRSIDWFGTVRGRLGYAWDRALLYATGGFAYGGGDDNNNVFNTFNTNNDDDIRSGYVVGGGLEYAFTNNWTAKIEGLYVNLDRSRNSRFVGTIGAAATPVLAIDSRRNNDDFAVVRVGLNYKFW